MFGETIDYHLLKTLAHGRNRATESELDDRAAHSTYALDEARTFLEKVQSVYFDGQIPMDPGLSYLDIGCGMGRLSVGLSLAGARDVTGIDIVERHIAEARKIAGGMDTGTAPTFHVADVHEWTPHRTYDVIFVLGAMEHIHHPEHFLKALPRFMSPTSLAFVSHEPFQSPIGDHMSAFFKIQIPWRGLLFSEKAVLRLRTEYFRPTDPATRYQDIVGGLNLMSFTQYVERVHNAGLSFVRHYFNPQVKHLRRYRALYPASWALTHIPRVQDYFIISAYSILKRQASR